MGVRKLEKKKRGKGERKYAFSPENGKKILKIPSEK